MRKVYGDSLRQEAGLTKTIRNVALKNAPLMHLAKRGNRLGAMGFAREFPGTVGRAYENTVDRVEVFVQQGAHSEGRGGGNRS